MPTTGLSSEMGWGDADADSERAWGAAASTTLLVATGLYWGLLWLLGGLQPFTQLALARREPGSSKTIRDKLR